MPSCEWHEWRFTNIVHRLKVSHFFVEQLSGQRVFQRWLQKTACSKATFSKQPFLLVDLIMVPNSISPVPSLRTGLFWIISPSVLECPDNLLQRNGEDIRGGMKRRVPDLPTRRRAFIELIHAGPSSVFMLY